MSKLPAYAAGASSSPALWLTLALLASYPLSGLLPRAWVIENGVTENLQVLVLAIGCMSALYFARRSARRADALLAAILAPVWVTLIGRELSWGAAFLPPTGFANGVAMYSSRFLWYKPAVAPLIVLAALVVLVTAWRHRLFGHAGRILRQQPALTPLLLLGAGAGAFGAWAEGHLGSTLRISHIRAMACEELFELVAYGAVVTAQWMALASPSPAALPAPATSR